MTPKHFLRAFSICKGITHHALCRKKDILLQIAKGGVFSFSFFFPLSCLLWFLEPEMFLTLDHCFDVVSSKETNFRGQWSLSCEGELLIAYRNKAKEKNFELSKALTRSSESKWFR